MVDFFKDMLHRDIILAYHSLYSPSGDPQRGYVSKSRSVPVDVFEAQMAWLADRATFVSLDEIIRGETTDGWSICVTFDDGYRNNIDLGLPIFRKYRVPVTWFVCPKFIGDQSHLPWWDLLDFINEKRREIGQIRAANLKVDLRNYDDLEQFRRISRKKFLGDQKTRDAFYRELKGACEDKVKIPDNAFADSSTVREAATSEWIELGGHTATHINIARATADELAEEIEMGCEKLRRWTDQPINWFAYPYGGDNQISRKAKEVVHRCGLRGAVTTAPAYIQERTSDFFVPRWTVPTSWGLSKFKVGVRALHATRKAARIKENVRSFLGLVEGRR